MSEVDWNDFSEKHRDFLNTEEGLNHLKSKIDKGDFGHCPVCKKPLLPVGRRYKPYMDGLYLICMKCDKIREEVDLVDGAIYGPWINLEQPYPPWIGDFK